MKWVCNGLDNRPYSETIMSGQRIASKLRFSLSYVLSELIRKPVEKTREIWR